MSVGQTFYVSLAVAITLIVNSVYCARLTEVISPHFEDDIFIYGSLQENSVLLHTYNFRNAGVSGELAFESIFWTTRSTIHHVIAIDQSGNQTGGSIIHYEIGEQYVSLVIVGNVLDEPLDILLRVSGALAPPANFFLGQLSERSVLAQTIHLNRSIATDDYFYESVTFNGRNISRVEAWDLSTDGNGGHVEYVYGGIGDSYLSLTFVGEGRGTAVIFEIKFYVDVFHNLEIGSRYDFTGRTIMALNERITVAGVEGELVNSTLQVGPSNFIIRSIEASDRTLARNGGWLNLTGGLDQSHLTLDLKSQDIGLGIDFSVAVFGFPTNGANHFMRGYFFYQDILIYSERLVVAADPENIVFGRVQFNTTGNRYIVLVQGIDQATDGYGGILSMFEGRLISQSVTIGLQSVGINLGIDFIVQMYGFGSE